MGAHPSAPPDQRWKRLEQLLDELRPGEIVTLRAVAARTGLDPDSVDTVLEALTRAELFTKLDSTTFVRESLAKAIDVHEIGQRS